MGGCTTTTSGGSNRCSDRCRKIVFGRKSSQVLVFAVVVTLVLTFALCDGEQNGVNGGDGDQTIIINPTSPMTADDDDNGKESIGYAAEWEYEGPPFHFEDSTTSSSSISASPNELSSKHPPSIFPNRRVGPGTWHDPTGNWWLFGGQSSSSSSSSSSSTSSQSHYLSDLWLYSERETRWNLIFRPEVSSSPSDIPSLNPTSSSSSNPSNSNPFTSAFPENLSFPLLCGSIHSRRLAIYGANPKKSLNSPKNPENLPFSEDNIVWLYDSAPSTISPKTSQSTWTSYVCCDACLPDGNATTNFEYCPQFTKDTLSWCDHSGIMMLQTSNPAHPSAPDSPDGYSTAPTIFSGLPKSNDDPPLIPSPSGGDGGGGNLNWWKFDVDSTEWIKLPPVTIQGGHQSQNIASILSSGQCRVVSTMMTGGDHTELVYILCPSSSSSKLSGNLLDRTLILFDPARGIASKLPGGIHLNRAFSDKKVWLPGRSTLHAISIPEQNKTLIFLAYQKLLDLWIHDHLKGRIYQVENVWKGDSLRVFQNVDQFYKLTVTLEGSPFSTKFFMANPRNPVRIMESYEDKLEGGHFRIMIVPDKEVFLPQRDASFLNDDGLSKHENNASISPPSSKSSSSSPKMIPPETIKMPIKRVPSSSPPPPPSSLSPELLQKLETHRKNKYRTDSRSPKLKNQNHSIRKSSKIPGIIIKKHTAFPSSSSSSSPLPTPSPSSKPDNKSFLSSSPSFPTITIKTSNSNSVDLTSSQISIRKSSHENNDLSISSTSTSLPPSSTSGGGGGGLSIAPSSTKTNTSSNATTTTSLSTKSQEVSSEKRKAITPKPLVMMMMAMMKPSQYASGGGAGTGGGGIPGNGKMAAMKIKSFITSPSPTPPTSTLVPSTSSNNNSSDTVGESNDAPSNIWRKPSNLSVEKREESLEINEQTEAVLVPVPTAQKLLQGDPSSSSLSSEREDDDDQVEMAVAMETTSRSSGGGGGGDEGLQAEGDIDDNHIRSPGSMVIGGARSEVESKMWRQGGQEQRIYESGGGNGMGGGGGGGEDDEEEGMISSMVNPTIFFAVSLSFFATIGVVLFVRRCVKCPPRESESALIKEPPPMRYSVIPDDLSFHLPIV